MARGREGIDNDVHQKPLFDADSIKESCVTPLQDDVIFLFIHELKQLFHERVKEVHECMSS